MSANNYIQIKETAPEKYSVSERDYESEGEICSLGIFDSMRSAVEKAEVHIGEVEDGVEYGIRFSLIGEDKRQEGELGSETTAIKKDFDAWNAKKKKIDAKEERLFFYQAEIWWVNLGLNIGYEMNGKGDEYMRPVIILNKYNEYSFPAVPLSTSRKTNKYRIHVGVVDGKEAHGSLSQLRNIDSKRLINKVGYVKAALFNEIKKKASQVNFG
jgi:mRNA interferase MazF